MKVMPHPRFIDLLNIFESARVYHQRWTGIAFRFSVPRWSSASNLISGQGAYLAGGRYNAKGVFRAVYSSSTPELALSESLSAHRRAGMPDAHTLPLIGKAISLDLHNTINLSNPHVLKLLGVTKRQLDSNPWWIDRDKGIESLTQAIGRAAWTSGLTALVVPTHVSASPEAVNLIIFPENLLKNDHMQVLRART